MSWMRITPKLSPRLIGNLITTPFVSRQSDQPIGQPNSSETEPDLTWIVILSRLNRASRHRALNGAEVMNHRLDNNIDN